MSGIHLSHLDNPSPQSIPDTGFAFLHQLPGPTVIHLNGQQAGKTRVVTTLLHGNEPSGLLAVHQLLKRGFRPLVDTKIIIASVTAALTDPAFTYRMLPRHRDLNRCFSPPYLDLQGQLACAIREYIVSCQPEAVVDIHNTSGSGPAFSVSTFAEAQHLALASHFTHRLIHTDIRLGSIMEQNLNCPVITVEVGGVQDQEAHENAFIGLQSYLQSEAVFALRREMELLSNPRRLELNPDTILNYATQPDCQANITICQDVEKHNFGVTRPEHLLGWLDNAGLQHFRLDKQSDGCKVEDFFVADEYMLRVKRPLKLFMITSRADIAKSDCLLYFVDAVKA